MFCQSLVIPPLPDDLEEALKFEFWSMYRNVNPISSYYNFEREEKNLAYLEKDNTSINDSGRVSFYLLSNEMDNKLKEFYRPYLFMFNFFVFQVVDGGSYTAPHVDDRTQRKEGFLYILDQGGDNVRTRWYTPKKEYADLYVPDSTGIPYDRLDIVEDHHLQYKTWYYGDFGGIHSVENIERTRVSLCPRT